jgi:predicted nucleic acid-binding protein
MNARIFFDTNVLLYFFSESGQRTLTAENLLLEGGIVSVQVLNEFVSVARGKLGMSWNEIRIARDKALILCPNPVSLTEGIHRSAVEISARYGYQIYDALILAAAMQAGCTAVYTEDMQHGQTMGNLTIVNPFLAQ